MQALCRRRLVPAPLCVRCSLKEESVGHMLSDCDRSRLIWRLSALGFDFSTGQAWSFADWFIDWMKNVPTDDLRCQSLFLLWKIWKDRTPQLFDDATLPLPHEVFHQALLHFQLSNPLPTSTPFDLMSDFDEDELEEIEVEDSSLPAMLDLPTDDSLMVEVQINTKDQTKSRKVKAVERKSKNLLSGAG
ncbi:OLC1v1005159C1 [Oldenlandia corymbosa var. corymbosa]|uniref:OLC1v1005159C1 n=1 Tax=Oldenlandia corymbosa var. corymbosa TaxID=529605 RepID=A0AAV1DER5_OLDCO|nr:OLC1v1005159C1 [Oldenlandia corymbosa var. corymbosa]